jgi:hypothetical protein
MNRGDLITSIHQDRELALGRNGIPVLRHNNLVGRFFLLLPSAFGIRLGSNLHSLLPLPAETSPSHKVCLAPGEALRSHLALFPRPKIGPS